MPYLKRQIGKKVMIGDNPSSHLSVDIIKECEKHNISFVFLPPNSTHLCQPLDVAFFAPLKKHWRSVLNEWKDGPGRSESTVPKSKFPDLLKKLESHVKHSAENVKAGFRACGIFPVNTDEKGFPDLILTRKMIQLLLIHLKKLKVNLLHS